MKPALAKAIVCALAAWLAAGCLESGIVTGPGQMVDEQRPDAAVPNDDPDAAVPNGLPDAAVPNDDPDAAVPNNPPDAAVPHTPDAAVPHPPDAAVPHPPDASVPHPPDASVPHPPDASVPHDPPDAGNTGGLDCTNAASWPADWVALENQVLVLVNQKRAAGATCGGVVKPPVPALVMDAKLRQAARCHSLDMARHNYFSHDSQDGRSPWTRIQDAGYTGFGNAENIAAGQDSAASVMQSWMTSTGHCNNIMTAGSNEIGIGYGLDTSSDFDRYWTQDFGKR